MLFQDNAKRKPQPEGHKNTMPCIAIEYAYIHTSYHAPRRSDSRIRTPPVGYAIHHIVLSLKCHKGGQHVLRIHSSRPYPLCTLNARSTYGITHVRCAAKCVEENDFHQDK